MAICVSGVPGTGKTTVSKILAKELKWKYVDVNSIIKEEKLYDSYDRSEKEYIVDEKKLSLFLAELIKINNELIIDSHLSHYIPKKYVRLCIITKCDIKVLNRRLMKRKYSKKKIRDNLDSEIFNVCFNEAKNNGHKVKVIETSKGILKSDIKELIGEINDRS